MAANSCCKDRRSHINGLGNTRHFSVHSINGTGHPPLGGIVWENDSSNICIDENVIDCKTTNTVFITSALTCTLSEIPGEGAYPSFTQ